MKHNLKVFFTALLIGMIASYIFCYKFDNPLTTLAKETKVTYFYLGSYNDYESANTKKGTYPEALIYNDNGIYKIIIGVYNEKDSIDLMSSYFWDKGLNFHQGELKVSSEFIKKISNYELLIKSSAAEKHYNDINNTILSLFNEYIN